MILEGTKNCEGGSDYLEDLMQMVLEGAKSCERSDDLLPNSTVRENFMIDNCKTMSVARHESTAITASWCLILLAIHQDWQDRVHAEELKVCGNGNLDANKLRVFLAEHDLQR